MKKSTQVALGGICAALCLFLMFMTSMFPFTQYAFPMMAGIVLIMVVIENGVSTAVLVYAAVSILAMIIVPNKEAALMFVGFFGYYPILKSKLEKIRFRILEYFVKMALFNSAIILSYSIMIQLFGIDEILDQTGPFGKYSLIVLLLLGNIMFFIYDRAVTVLVTAYINWFRPKILRKVK